jgi:hypothetical protein
MEKLAWYHPTKSGKVMQKWYVFLTAYDSSLDSDISSTAIAGELISGCPLKPPVGPVELSKMLGTA